MEVLWCHRRNGFRPGMAKSETPPMSPVLPIQVEQRTETPRKDCDKAAKEGECTLVPPMSSVMPVQMAGCIVMPQEAWAEAEKAGMSLR